MKLKKKRQKPNVSYIKTVLFFADWERIEVQQWGTHSFAEILFDYHAI